MLNMTSDPRFLDPDPYLKLEDRVSSNQRYSAGPCKPYSWRGFMSIHPEASTSFFLEKLPITRLDPFSKVASLVQRSFIHREGFQVFNLQMKSETLPGHDPRILEESNMLPVGLTNIRQTHFMNLYFSFIPCYGSYLVSTNTPAMNPNCTGPVPLQAHVSGAVPCLTVVESYKVSVRSHLRMERKSSLRFFHHQNWSLYIQLFHWGVMESTWPAGRRFDWYSHWYVYTHITPHFAPL